MLRWKSSLKPAAAAAADYRSTILADSPVAYWRLGESSGSTASDEIGSSDGTYGGGVTLGVTGALSGDSNTSISLAGSSTRYDGVTVSSLTTASYSSGITIELWVNWDSTNYSGFGIEAYRDSNNRIFLDTRDSTPHWDFRISGTWYSNVGAGFQNGWHLYAFTHDGTNAKTYRDGVLQNTQSASATTFDPTSMGIGQGSAGYNVFTGGIDEAAIYNSALSATELLAHYTAGASTPAGDAIILNGYSRTDIGGVESSVVTDGSSTVYGGYAIGRMDFRDATKNSTWTDDGLGLLWDHSTDATNWVALIGTTGGTFNVYEQGTTTLIFSLAWTGTGAFSGNVDRYGSTSVDFTGTVPANNTRVDVYHI